MGDHLGKLIARPDVQAVLPDLDRSMSPAACRGIAGWPEQRVKSVLRTIAAELYHHEKHSQIWKGNVRTETAASPHSHGSDCSTTQVMDGRNALLYWIHRVDVEKADTYTSSIRATARQRTPATPEQAPTERGPHHTSGSSNSARTVPVTYAALTEFECLYYMTCVKVSQLYRNLQTRFVSGFLKLSHTLHERGEDPRDNTFAPFSMGDMAELLRIKWTMLMNPMLVATLDAAIRALPEDERIPRAKSMRMFREDETYDEALGLANVNKKPEVSIFKMVGSKHESELKAEVEEDNNRALVRAVTRAAVDFPRLPGMHAGQQSHDSDQVHSAPSDGCACEDNCVCRSRCLSQILKTCLCKTSPLCRQLRYQSEIDKAINQLQEEAYGQQVGEQYLLNAPTNGMAQLQIATWGSGCNPSLVQANLGVQQALADMEIEFVHDKLISQGVTPPKAPFKTSEKKTKDPYPLGLYEPIDPPKRNSQGNGTTSKTDPTVHSSTAPRQSSPNILGTPFPSPPPTKHKSHTTNSTASYYKELLDLAPHPTKLSDKFLQEQVMYAVAPLNIPAKHGSAASSRVPFEQDMYFPTMDTSPPRHTSFVRPTNMRRYVSAGGPGQLHEREQIEWNYSAPTNEQTWTVSKATFDAALDAMMATCETVPGVLQKGQGVSMAPPVPPKNPARVSPKSDMSSEAGAFEMKGETENKRALSRQMVSKVNKKFKRSFSHQ